MPANSADDENAGLSGLSASGWKRYLTEEAGRSQLGIRPLGFQEYELLNPDESVIERSMLSQSEIALLFALARDYYTGNGEIVDLGPLLGVGTNALSKGLAQNTRVIDKSKRIHSFDLFLAKGMGTVITQAARSGSVLDRFLRNNDAYRKHLSVAAGDVLEMDWDRTPVEILFIDLAKSWALNRHVVPRFFPYLIPGRSVVLQQDYVHFAEYWIAITMEMFADYFRHLFYVDGATSVFLLTHEIPNHVLYAEIETLPLDRKLHYLERARAKAPPSVREILKCAQAKCLIENDRMADASAVLESIERAAGTDDEPDFSGAIAANARAVIDELRSRTGIAVGARPVDMHDESPTLLADPDVVLDRQVIGSKDTFSARVRVRNIGATTWSLVDSPVGVVNLGAHLLDEHQTAMVAFDFLRHRIAAPPRTSVAQGEEVEFGFEFAPPLYGRYVLEFDLVCEMVCWFARNGSATVRIPITV
jgi:hypothetical protein